MDVSMLKKRVTATAIAMKVKATNKIISKQRCAISTTAASFYQNQLYGIYAIYCLLCPNKAKNHFLVGKICVYMRKCSPAILIVIPILLFVFAFIVDGSNFGRDWVNFWKDLDVIRTLMAIAVVTGIGFLLGLIPFRTKTYRQKLLITIPIAFIIFSTTLIADSIIFYYGLREEYNYFTAKRDIRNGQIQILGVGLIVPDPNMDWDKLQAAEKIVEKHFSYKYVHLGCTFTNGVGFYNDVMSRHLEKVNSRNWRYQAQQMLDSILAIDSEVK